MLMSFNTFRRYRFTASLGTLLRNLNHFSLLQELRYFLSFATVRPFLPTLDLHTNVVLLLLLFIVSRPPRFPISLIFFILFLPSIYIRTATKRTGRSIG